MGSVATWVAAATRGRAAEMKQEKCQTCKFHVLGGDSDITGQCHRFPIIVPKQIHEWCGEHKKKE